MQSSSATWNYTYDTSGLRTQRSNGTTTYRYWYNDNGLLLRMEKGSTVYSFTYDPAGRPVSISDGNTRYYYVLNQQGDVIGLLNSNAELIVMYVYDAWGRVLASADLTASGIGTNNPLRYRGYVYDTETELYYLQSRYYNPSWGRFINADDPGYMGVDGTMVSYNLFAYCGNNPVMGFDPSGTFDWGSLFQGIGWLTTGVTALFVGLSVLTCGVATPFMVGVALLTTGAGALTMINGASEMGEAFTGYNVMRDGLFQGNDAAYNAYAYSTATVAQVGTAICGGWTAKNAPRIEAYNNIQNYQYADGAATHIGQRSYYDSTLFQKQIIKYGRMTNEGNGVYTFRIAGSSFNTVRQSMHYGIWELTTINSLRLIGHFLMKY